MLKKFKFRWHDIDANRHIANTSYNQICIDLRMDALTENGLDHNYFQSNQIGPVVIREEAHYLSEVMADEELYVDLELDGMTRDGRLFRLAHHIYGEDKEIVYYTTAIIGILNLELRKLITPPEPMKLFLDQLSKTDNYRKIKKSELRLSHVPYDKMLDLD